MKLVAESLESELAVSAAVFAWTRYSQALASCSARSASESSRACKFSTASSRCRSQATFVHDTASQFWLGAVYTIQHALSLHVWMDMCGPWLANATHESFQYTERRRQGKSPILPATVAPRRELFLPSSWHPSRETRTEFLPLIEKTRCPFRPPA